MLYLGDLLMSDISNVAIIQWQNELMKIKDDRGQTYSPTYLRTIHAQLSSILNHACRYYNLKTNVARDVGTMGEKEADEMLFWTQEEYEAFIKAVKSGLSKQDYFIQLFGEHKINITADYRVLEAIAKEVFQLARVIKKFGKLSGEEQDILLYVLEIYEEIKQEKSL